MAERPNIIYIMADDMGYGDLGCYGAEKIPTPNMDRVAAEGMRFTDCHAAASVCTPSRVAALTGRYCWRYALKWGVEWGFSLPLIDPARMTVASMLKARGYATAAVGKWHCGWEWQGKDHISPDFSAKEDLDERVDYAKPIVGGPTALGFDYFFGIAGSLDMPPYCFVENDRTVGIPSVEKQPYHAQQRKGLMVPGWRDDQVDVHHAEKAVAWLRKTHEADPDKPFFLYLTPSAPHRPCEAPDFCQGKSQAGPRGDMVCVVDWVVGQVLETLDDLGIADNTLLMVTSDNGARPADVDGDRHGHKSCGDLRGFKAHIWDGGHREPFVVRWPERIRAGTECDRMICLADLMASCADITGAALPENAAEDSFSFLPLLSGEDGETRPTLVHHSVRGMFGIREGRWKLCCGRNSGGFEQDAKGIEQTDDLPGQLYDMDEDWQETTNLYGERPDVVERLEGVLARIRESGRSRPR